MEPGAPCFTSLKEGKFFRGKDVKRLHIFPSEGAPERSEITLGVRSMCNNMHNQDLSI